MAVSDKDRARAQVEEARRALDDDLATLTDRLPAAAVIAQAGAAGGIGLAVLGAAAKQLQQKLAQRSEEKALTREAEIQARAIAAAIAAAGLHGQQGHAQHGHTPGTDDETSSRPEVSVPVPPPTHRDDDGDGGPPWGILLLLAGLVAAVVAVVLGKDDENVWDSPEPVNRATAPEAVITPGTTATTTTPTTPSEPTEPTAMDPAD